MRVNNGNQRASYETSAHGNDDDEEEDNNNNKNNKKKREKKRKKEREGGNEFFLERGMKVFTYRECNIELYVCIYMGGERERFEEKEYKEERVRVCIYK